MRKTITTVFLAFTTLTFSSEVKSVKKESLEKPELNTEWCHVTVDCDEDGYPDYWGDVDCEFEEDLREQYKNSCTGEEIPIDHID